MSKIDNIIEGWKNHFSGDKLAYTTALSRSEQCATCEYAVPSGMVFQLVNDEIKTIEGFKCNLCNCPLSAKLRSLNEKCDIGKWGPIQTSNEKNSTSGSTSAPNSRA